MTSMISSNKIMMKERLMNHMKERIKTWLLGSRCSSCPVSGVAPNLRIQSFIREFSTAIACGVCLTFSPFLLEFISRLVVLHSVH